jgi:pilus assembly protein CpaE
MMDETTQTQTEPENEVRPAGRERARIYVTGDCDGLPDVREALANHPEVELIGSADQVAEAAPMLTGGHLQVVLHATRSTALPVNEIAALREHTRAPIVLLASNGSPALLEDALEHDVADVLLLPQLTDNIVFAIRKAGHAGKRLTGASKRHGRLVTVFSPKGGTGKTVAATNLGTSLAKHWGKRALLLDLDLQFGDAAIMLGIEPDKTIYDLVTAPGELDSEKLAGYTTRHASGLDVLPAPLRPEDAELVTEAKLARLLEVARESYDVIVVDTSPFFHGPMLATLDRTDELLLICGLDVPTLKNVRLSLQTLELLSFPPDRIKLVLNRANSKVGMKPKEVEAALEREIAYEIPSDRSVPLAVNRGNPAVLSDGKADFSRAVRAMAKELVAAQAADKQKKSFLATLGRNNGSS